MMDRLYQEAESIVLAMWDEEPEEVAAEISVQLSISADYAWELVQQVIVNEIRIEEGYNDGDNDLFDWDGDALASAGFGTDEDYF
ncbi:MAG: hypothetical protein ISQ84_00080 [Pelagibacterales bacterium]|nr:hypothetical protein [Pelagibacterales bacterium]